MKISFLPLWAAVSLAGLGGCISERREQELGDEMAATVNSQLTLVENPLLTRYVAGVGDTIATVSGRPELDYRFYIINSATVNAFALPGGHVYVTRGLIERTQTGSELAGVLAHEIGHIVRRHGVDKLQRSLRTGSLVSVMYGVILGGEPELLHQNSLRMAGALWSADHSREDEQEADRLAVEYLILAGINPSGMVTLLENLAMESKVESGSRSEAWFSSHPLTATRLAETRADIRSELGDAPARVSAPLEFPMHDSFLRLVGSLPAAADSAR